MVRQNSVCMSFVRQEIQWSAVRSLRRLPTHLQSGEQGVFLLKNFILRGPTIENTMLKIHLEFDPILKCIYKRQNSFRKFSTSGRMVRIIGEETGKITHATRKMAETYSKGFLPSSMMCHPVFVMMNSLTDPVGTS